MITPAQRKSISSQSSRAFTASQIQRLIFNEPNHEELTDDKPLMLKVVENHGSLLKIASNRLKADLEVVIAAYQSDPLSFSSAATLLRHDNHPMQIFLKRMTYLDPNSLALLGEQNQDDYTIVNRFVSQNGFALKYASQRLRDDETIVLTAIKSNGFALGFASTRFKNDHSFAKLAVAQNGSVYEKLPTKMRSNIDIAKTAFSNYGESFEFAPDKFKTNKELALTSICQTSTAFKHVKDPLKTDIQFLLQAIKANPTVFKLFDEKSIDNEIIAYAAVTAQQGLSFYMSDRIKDMCKYDQVNQRLGSDSLELLKACICQQQKVSISDTLNPQQGKPTKAKQNKI